MANLKNISIDTICTRHSCTYEIRLDWGNDLHQAFRLDDLKPESVADGFHQLSLAIARDLAQEKHRR
jgi:hypothetical protein